MCCDCTQSEGSGRRANLERLIQLELLSAMFGSAQRTLLQAETEPQVRGRVFSAYFAVFGLAQLVGMLGLGLLGDTLGVMLINTRTVDYLLASGFVLWVSARGMSRQYRT